MKIIWFISTPEDLRFARLFSEISPTKIILFHLNLITRLLAIGSGLRSVVPRGSSTVSIPDLRDCFNVLSGRLTENEAKQAYSATFATLDSIDLYEPNSALFMIPSGRHAHHLAAKAFARKHMIKTLFINYSNFPGFTFFDPEGTDCLASIYKNPKILESLTGYSDDSKKNMLIFDKFSKLKRNQKLIPQAKNTGALGLAADATKVFSFMFDAFAQSVFGVYSDRKFKLAQLKIRKMQSPLPDGSVWETCSQSSEYIFFPLQVSTDQQVLVNYEGGSIFSAIDEALNLCKTKLLPMVVREHPAETNIAAIREYIDQLRREGNGIFFSRLPIYSLIDGAKEVVTINSTVGLEVRLTGKKIHFLGQSFYAKASDAQLASYLENYLVPVDYHRGKGLSPTIASDILRRFN